MEEVWERYGRGVLEATGNRGAFIKRVLPCIVVFRIIRDPNVMKMCPMTLAQVRANHGAVHGTLAEPFVEEVWKRYGRTVTSS